MYGTSPMFTMPVSSVDSGRSNDNYGNWNNPFVYLVWMWAFSMFGGNGLWGNRNGAGTVETQAITASQVDDIRAQVAAIRQGIECGDANIMRAVDQLADTARANQIKIDGGFTSVNQNLCSGFGSVNSNICDAKTAVLGALCNIEHNLAMQGCQFANQMQQCCCELKTAIGDVGWDKEEHAHDPFSANSEETEDEDRCHAWGENPMGRLFLLVDELQELAYKGHGPQVIEKRFREACSDEVCDEELKVMGRLVLADGFRKHASALGMTKEAFKKHLASIADKIKRDDTDDED